MARSISISCPPVPTNGSKEVNTKSYSIHLVTPLFGGGVEAGKNDPVTLIRGASIRGQLRFWWRATRGARFPSIEELGKSEGEIWGTSKTPSLVSIEIRNIQIGKQTRWAEYKPDRKSRGFRSLPDSSHRDFPMYALFPFQGKTERGKSGREVVEQPATVTWVASFELVVSCPDKENIAKDIEAAVWAWVNFGGLGARTRRGCGSLFCEALAPSDVNKVQEWYSQKLKEYDIALSEISREWPILPLSFMIKPGAVNPLKAWSEAVKLLQDFRQGPGIGRNGRQGRSYWPEADSLRRITGQGSPKHRTSITTSENAFPRAELGLPIIFHFQGNEMPDCELYPQDSQRMASPLILKPLALRQNQALPVVIRLNTKPLEQIRVTNAPALSQNEIRRPDLATYNNSPLKNRSLSGSALEAFMAFVEEKGFK